MQWDGAGTPQAFVVSRNIRRRHLTGKQKRELIMKLLKAEPEKSDRRIAKEIGASHRTIAAVRSTAEDGGQIAHHATRVDARGTRQPAKKAKKPAPAKTAKPKPAKTSKTKRAVETIPIRLSAPDGEIAKALIEAVGQRKARDIAGKIIEIIENDDRIVRDNSAVATAP